MTITLKIDNPHLEEVTIEALQFFINAFKQNQKDNIQKIDIDALPSSVDKYIGIIKESEVDLDYKNSRANYLAEKYL